MPERYGRARDLDSWQRDHRLAERGFVHAWRSRVAAGNGEDFFVAELDRRIRPDDVVLDLGCGHGELALSLAERCRLVVGVDRDARVVELARELAAERGVTNVRFSTLDVRADAAPADLPGELPLSAGAVTMIVNRRGPTADKWLGWVRPYASRDCMALVMHPAGGPPEPNWHAELPPELRSRFGALPYDEVQSWVTGPLAEHGRTDYQLWWFDVPEWFTTAEDLRARLGARPEQLDALRQVVARHRDPNGLALRHQRLVAAFRLPSAADSTKA